MATFNPTKLEFDKNGFTCTIQGHARYVEWVFVREVTGYRKPGEDGGVLCVALRVDTSSDYIEVHEDMDSYSELLEHLYTQFSSIRRNWWHELVSEYGKNRKILYGIAHGQESAAEKYLSKRKEVKKLSSRDIKRWVVSGAGIVLLAAIQLGLVRLIARWESSELDDIIGVSLFPGILVIISCRYWGLPRVFFAQMTTFYLAELLMVAMFDRQSPSLMGKFLRMELYYLMVLGLMLLMGLGVMLLPSNRAVGRR